MQFSLLKVISHNRCVCITFLLTNFQISSLIFVPKNDKGNETFVPRFVVKGVFGLKKKKKTVGDKKFIIKCLFFSNNYNRCQKHKRFINLCVEFEF